MRAVTDVGYEHRQDPDMEATTDRVMLWGVFLLAAMVLAFPLYLMVEPTNRAESRAQQLQSLQEHGRELYQLNCAGCHGLNGEGGAAPALNSRQFLQASTDEQTELLTAVGVPGSAMGAYSQDYGGPFTSEQIKALAVFIRAWEESAPDVPNWRNPQG